MVLRRGLLRRQDRVRQVPQANPSHPKEHRTAGRPDPETSGPPLRDKLSSCLKVRKGLYPGVGRHPGCRRAISFPGPAAGAPPADQGAAPGYRSL